MDKRDGKDLLGEEVAVGGVGAAPAEVEGGIEPIGNPSFHCSNICSGSNPVLPGGDKDPIRGEEERNGRARAGGEEGKAMAMSKIGAETKNTHGRGREWVLGIWVAEKKR